MTEDVRAVWRAPSLDAFLQDVRYAMRTMRRTPAVTGIAVGSAALGSGACSVIFAILNFALFTPLPVEDPQRLMSVSEIVPRTDESRSVSPSPSASRGLPAACCRRQPG